MLVNAQKAHAGQFISGQASCGGFEGLAPAHSLTAHELAALGRAIQPLTQQLLALRIRYHEIQRDQRGIGDHLAKVVV